MNRFKSRRRVLAAGAAALGSVVLAPAALGQSGQKPLRLQIRNQRTDILLVNCGNGIALTQVALTLASLAGQDMAGKGMGTLHLAGTGLFEALGSCAIGLDFRHCLSPSVLCYQ